ncbi:MAG: prepilin-type N-terminal cleavage/methylation domain-containing protein [bacterium]
MKTRTHSIDGEGAFTLVELLVVIAIIAILSAIITANFTSAKSKARDAQRVSDLAQINLAIAGYFDRCNIYPASPLDVTSGYPTVSTCPSGITLGTFISKIPNPPVLGESYYYVVNATQDDYLLQSTLENPVSPTGNSITDIPADLSAAAAALNSPTGVVCNGTNTYCVGPK